MRRVGCAAEDGLRLSEVQVCTETDDQCFILESRCHDY